MRTCIRGTESFRVSVVLSSNSPIQSSEHRLGNEGIIIIMIMTMTMTMATTTTDCKNANSRQRVHSGWIHAHTETLWLNSV